MGARCADTKGTMKRFLSKLKRGAAPESDGGSIAGASSVASESDSLQDLKPMFNNSSSGHFTNDVKLSINPSITYSDSFITEGSRDRPKSVFSSKFSGSTKQSSYVSSRKPKPTKQYRNTSQPLQILDTPEETKEDASNVLTSEIVADKLHHLCAEILYAQGQYATSVSNLSNTTLSFINSLKEHNNSVHSMKVGGSWLFDSYNNANVRRILKVFLHFYDNLLNDEAYLQLKLILSRDFNDFCTTLATPLPEYPKNPYCGSKSPQNMAIGCNDGKPYPNEAILARILDRISCSPMRINEQNGSFIAPILRGISKSMCVICLYFGYPNIEDRHVREIASIRDLFDDVHVVLAKNRIDLASLGPSPVEQSNQQAMNPHSYLQKFKLPFRYPADPKKPPMSLSLSAESSARLSGTMGGFLYPIIDKKKQAHLLSYADSKFSISCGHVCLDGRIGEEYPQISSPLSVLIGLYKKALMNEFEKTSLDETSQSITASRIAYGSVLKQIDSVFPARTVKTIDPISKRQITETKNFPKHRFGQIIWGERALIPAKITSNAKTFVEKRLSDLAIIKVNKAFQCDQNYLGDDIAFNEFDPALIFDNLYVRQVVDLQRYAKEVNSRTVKEVDSFVSTSPMRYTNSTNHRGLPVFKYGSTTKLTKGNLNGIKLVYWMDGAIHSSEFVVNSVESTTSFAAGGDSGAWILSKLEDVKGSLSNKGLGVIGMLHSYDGEYKQFGLFTPMTEILERLAEVTQIPWGVVGVQTKGLDTDAENASLSSLGLSDSDLSDYESIIDDHSF